MSPLSQQAAERAANRPSAHLIAAAAIYRYVVYAAAVYCLGVQPRFSFFRFFKIGNWTVEQQAK